MRTRAIHHCIHVLDLDKSLDFYKRALGLDVIRRMGPSDGSWENVFIGNDTTGFQIELTWNRGRTEPYNNGGRDTHIAFAVEDMKNMRVIHDEMGCVCFDNERMGIYFIEDPDGCWIEIVPTGRNGNDLQPGIDLLEVMRNRRSVRKYTGEPIDDEALDRVLKAGLLAPSGRGMRPWELIVVRERVTLARLAQCRSLGSQILENADAAIVVTANTEKSDTWIEDCSTVMENMYLMADAIGLGSCWIQVRERQTADKRDSQDYVAEVLNIPAPYKTEAILSLGMPLNKPIGHVLGRDLLDKIHREAF